jgi:DNA-binding CsgD family transcriptional regulator
MMVRMPGKGLEKALDFMLDVSAQREPDGVVRCVVEGLPRFVASEITTLSICDIPAGTRRVVSYPHDAISPSDQACFNRLMHEHPLVRYHSTHPHGGSQRVSDCTAARDFRRQAIFGDYYARIGIDHVIAVPVVASPGLVMSYVLNRKGMDFSDAERSLLDAMRPALANLYRFTMLDAAARECEARSDVAASLTAREREVLRWVAAGKSDRQTAAILGNSVRTVQKHLENAYVKLGVENRTAAAMRFAALARAERLLHA